VFGHNKLAAERSIDKQRCGYHFRKHTYPFGYIEAIEDNKFKEEEIIVFI
jgi:hypothetical protein